MGAIGFRWSSTVGAAGTETLEAALRFSGREIAFRLRVTFENERQHKQRMRALYWYLKTKVEAILFGLVDLEEEFFPYLLTKDNRTLYELQRSSLAQLLLPPGGE